MRYGYMMGNGYGGIIMMIIILLAAVAVLYLFIRSIDSGGKTSSNPRHELIIDILKHRYVTNQISADQYIDMKKIIEAEINDSPELLGLKEQFARGELDADKYWQSKGLINISTRDV